MRSYEFYEFFNVFVIFSKKDILKWINSYTKLGLFNKIYFIL